MPYKDPEKAREYKRKWIANYRKRTQQVEPSRTQQVEPCLCVGCPKPEIKKLDKFLTQFKKFQERQRKKWRGYKKKQARGKNKQTYKEKQY